MGTESRVTENETREFGMGDGMQPGFGNDGLLGDVGGVSGALQLEVWFIGVTWELVRTTESAHSTPTESDSQGTHRLRRK